MSYQDSTSAVLAPLKIRARLKRVWIFGREEKVSNYRPLYFRGYIRFFLKLLCEDFYFCQQQKHVGQAELQESLISLGTRLGTYFVKDSCFFWREKPDFGGSGAITINFHFYQQQNHIETLVESCKSCKNNWFRFAPRLGTLFL